MVAIAAFAGNIPEFEPQAIVDANSWANPALKTEQQTVGHQYAEEHLWTRIISRLLERQIDTVFSQGRSPDRRLAKPSLRV